MGIKNLHCLFCPHFIFYHVRTSFFNLKKIKRLILGDQNTLLHIYVTLANTLIIMYYSCYVSVLINIFTTQIICISIFGRRTHTHTHICDFPFQPCAMFHLNDHFYEHGIVLDGCNLYFFYLLIYFPILYIYIIPNVLCIDFFYFF